jgi:hypothetical protein
MGTDGRTASLLLLLLLLLLACCCSSLRSSASCLRVRAYVGFAVAARSAACSLLLSFLFA